MNTNLTDAYINYLVSTKEPVMVFVKIGSSIKLSGTLVGYDDESFFLMREGITQMLARVDVSTVNPVNPFSLDDVVPITA